MSERAQTAIDQLRIANDIDDDYSNPEREINYHLHGALVHAILDVADAIRTSGLSGWSVWDAAAQRQP